ASAASLPRARESPEKQVGDARGERRALSVGVRYFFGELPRFHRLFESALSDERLAEQVAGLEVGTGAQRETRQPLSEVDLADRPRVPGARDQHARFRSVPHPSPPARPTHAPPSPTLSS